MGIFNRVNKAAISPAPEFKAAAGWSNTGASQIGNFYSYYESNARARLMSIPTVARGRDLIAGTIGSFSLKMYRETWNETEAEMQETELAPRSWIRRIDKSVPNNFILSWTVDDLIFTGNAFWYVTERGSDSYPLSFTRLPASMVTLEDQANTGIRFGPSKQILFNGMPIDYKDVVQFLSPIQGLNSVSPRAFETAIRLEDARLRNSVSSQPSVTLKQTGGEPLSPTELADLSAAYDYARMSNSTCAVNEFLDVIPNNATPDKMMLIESSNYQAQEMCRLIGIPGYLAGISSGSYAYTNNLGARQDLFNFAIKPMADCIAQTLSSDNVLPRGVFVSFDVDDYLSETYLGEDSKSELDQMENEVSNQIPVPEEMPS